MAIRVPASPDAAKRVVELARDGAEVLHLVFDAHGREDAPSNPRHARDVLREVHGALVKDGTRDQVTLIASGGIAQAEHMAKAIICGADLVAIDIPLMIALECRLCGECDRGEPCQIALDEIDPALRGEADGQPHGRVALAAARDARRDGHPRGAAAARRGRPVHVLRGPRTRDLRPAVRNAQEGQRGDMSTDDCQQADRDAAAEEFLDRPEYAQVTREVRPAVPRYRNEIGKFRVHRASTCKQCGRCVEVCRYGVHTRPDGYRLIVRPLDYRCIGPDCEKTDDYCVDACPQKALSLTDQPGVRDPRRLPLDAGPDREHLADGRDRPRRRSPHLECEIGASGGGFDRICLKFPVLLPPACGARISPPRCCSTAATIHASG